MDRLLDRAQTLLMLLVMLLALQCHGASLHAGQQGALLEQSICGWKEPFVFWLWSTAAGEADAARPERSAAIEAVTVTTVDGRALHGYRYRSTPAPARPDQAAGYLLVAPGNAMLADQLIEYFSPFAAHGYDVYIFDYRGYGRSEGKRRLQAMLGDYRQIIRHLDAQPYRQRAFYGISFGGVVLLDALRQQWGERAVVIDSTPSRLSDYGCPAAHDPVNNLPPDAHRLLLIAGARDTVVTVDASRELLEQAETHGATVHQDPNWGHPFMDGHTRHRLETVRRFLLQE